MKYYFIFCLYLIFILPLSAQERKERPQFKLGGALRFNYNFSDWNSGHRDRGGDLGYDVFMLRPTASYKGFLLDADCRFYSTAFGGFMLKYGWIGYRFSEKNHLEIGLTKVPFGLQPGSGNNFFLQISYFDDLQRVTFCGIIMYMWYNSFVSGGVVFRGKGFVAFRAVCPVYGRRFSDKPAHKADRNVRPGRHGGIS